MAASARSGSSRAGSVASLVRTASRARSALELVVALLLGVGGACVMQGALVLSGGEPRSAGAWLVASLAGLLCACAWKLENPVSEAATARALDRGLHQQGGLVATWEARAAGTSSSPLAELAEARCLARIELPAALRAGFPSLVLPIAAPLVGAALLALSLEAREVSRAAPERELLDALRGLTRTSQALSSELRARTDPEDAEPVELEAAALAEALAARVDAFEEALRRAPEDATRSAAAGELAEYARDLGRLSELLGGRPDLRERVAEAQNALDSGRRAAEPGGARTGAAAGPGSGDVTRGRPAGTMPSPVDPDRRLPGPSAAPAGPERGAFAATSWPAEYDGIVSEWVEHARRRASEPRDPPPER
jgi:hypothetical protein